MLLANRTETNHRWLRVRNLKLAPGSEVEVKAGLQCPDEGIQE